MKGYIASAIGRRKTSTARVYLKKGKGEFIVNGQDLKTYFGRDTLLMMISQPLVVVGMESEFSIKINCDGGGKSGQAGAVRLGITRALAELNSELRPLLKPHGFFTRDPRAVERKKFGRHGARKRPQYSKR